MSNVIGIWGIQDGSDRSKEGWMDFFPTHDHAVCKIEDVSSLKQIVQVLFLVPDSVHVG